MNTENIPQVGSKWDFENDECEVTAVRKVGRGHQIEVRFVDGFARKRLRDFLKVAKPL